MAQIDHAALPDFVDDNSLDFADENSADKMDEVLTELKEEASKDPEPLSAREREKVGRTLCWILRHAAPSLKLKVLEGAWVDTHSILAILDTITALPPMDDDKLKYVAHRDIKGRFEYVSANGIDTLGYMRCVQGHSFVVRDDGTLTPPVKLDVYPFAFQYTNAREARRSVSSGCIKRRRRTHIHLTPATSSAAPTHVPASHQYIALLFDLERATNGGGLAFAQSRNNYILTPGDMYGQLPLAFLHSAYRYNYQDSKWEQAELSELGESNV